MPGLSGLTPDLGSVCGRLFLQTSVSLQPLLLPLPPPQEFAFVPLMASSVPVVSLTFAWTLPHPGAWGKRAGPLLIALGLWPVPE